MMHTKEPWKPGKRLNDMVRIDDDIIAIFIGDNAVCDCARARACINALAGLNPEAIPEVVAAWKGWLAKDTPGGPEYKMQKLLVAFNKLAGTPLHGVDALADLEAE